METEIIPADPDRPDPSTIAHAAELLERGAVVAFPTETVYGLGCLPEHGEAVARIYTIKDRPPDRPLALYLASPSEIARHAGRIPAEAYRLIERFLPGPLTVILEGQHGSKTGFRVSPHRVLTALIEAVGRPLVGTSANLSGSPSPTTAAEVVAAFSGRIEAVLDAGKTELGTDSTVIDCTSSPPVIVRKGVITAAEIASVLGVPIERVRQRSGPRPS